MNKTYLLLGSNEGDRLFYLRSAVDQISETVGKVSAKSSIYQTAPWGNQNQAEFLNQVLEVQTSLDPLKLLKQINVIEQDLGRKREIKWGSRLIDIDILFYNDEIIRYKDLYIPHKELHNRLFTLIPLQEIAAEIKHPVFNISVNEMVNRCKDTLTVTKLETRNSKHEN
ncbi:MAG: 2-amino-4-hydroxy-6-hydroxymethyldihydropteridine diphosphokinase [Cytophagaceae bacterium]